MVSDLKKQREERGENIKFDLPHFYIVILNMITTILGAVYEFSFGQFRNLECHIDSVSQILDDDHRRDKDWLYALLLQIL